MTQLFSQEGASYPTAEAAARLARLIEQWCEQAESLSPEQRELSCELVQQLNEWVDAANMAGLTIGPEANSQGTSFGSAPLLLRPHRNGSKDLPRVASLLGEGTARPLTPVVPRARLPRKSTPTSSAPFAPLTLNSSAAGRNPTEIVPLPTSSKGPSQPKPKRIRPPAGVPDQEPPASTTPADEDQPVVARSPKTELSSPKPRRSFAEAKFNPVAERPAPARVSRADFSLPVRWWNVPFALAILWAASLAIGWAGMETIRVAVPQAALARSIQNPKSSPETLLSAARALPSSPLTRWSATKELALARATLAANERRDLAHSAIPDASTLLQTARHLFERASNKSPHSPWHQLNWAQSAPPDKQTEAWANLTRWSGIEPIVDEQLSVHLIASGNKEMGLVRLEEQMERNARRVIPILSELTTQGVSSEEAVRIVPNDPETWRQVIRWSRQEPVIGLHRALEQRLTQEVERETNSPSAPISAARWGEWASLEAELERWSKAAEYCERAISLEPTNGRWKIALAEVRLAQNQVDQARLILSELGASSLSPVDRSKVAELQSKLPAKGETMPAPSSLRAN